MRKRKIRQSAGFEEFRRAVRDVRQVPKRSQGHAEWTGGLLPSIPESSPMLEIVEEVSIEELNRRYPGIAEPTDQQIERMQKEIRESRLLDIRVKTRVHMHVNQAAARERDALLNANYVELLRKQRKTNNLAKDLRRR